MDPGHHNLPNAAGVASAAPLKGELPGANPQSRGRTELSAHTRLPFFITTLGIAALSADGANVLTEIR